MIILAFAILFVASIVKAKLFNHNKSYQVTLPGGIKTLILGDSHAQQGINPDYLEASVNISQSSEFLMYSYYKLAKILQSDNGIENVVLTYSYHSLSKYGSSGSSEMLKRYHMLLDEAFYRDFFIDEGVFFNFVIRYLADVYKIPFGVANDFAECLNFRKYRGTLNAPYIGSFISAGTSVVREAAELDKTIQNHYHKNHGIKDISAMKIAYLERISDLCGASGINLYLVNTPVHDSYYRKIPEKFIREVDSAAESLENATTHYINYSQLALPDSDFYDCQHLNQKGAVVLSKKLSADILTSSRS